jgi:hypothetical protein
MTTGFITPDHEPAVSLEVRGPEGGVPLRPSSIQDSKENKSAHTRKLLFTSEFILNIIDMRINTN